MERFVKRHKDRLIGSIAMQGFRPILLESFNLMLI